MRKDPTEFRERFLRWKKGELVYENGLALPAYEDGLTSLRKSEVNTNLATYNPEEDLYTGRYTLPEVTVTGDKKKVGTGMGKRLYMHPWKTVGDLSREQHEQMEIEKAVWGGEEGYAVHKDLNKPLSPVDPVGEFVVATATLNPAFKYMFGGMGSAAAELTGFNSAKQYMSNYIRQHVPLGIYDTRKLLLTGLIRGNYMADGSESDIFTNVAGDKVFKVNTDAVSSTIKGARDFANRYMQQRNSVGQLPITLKGIVRDVTKGRNKSAVYRPVFEQERVTPLPENADFNQVLQTFNKNGDRVIDGNIITANGKVIRDLNPYNIGIDKNGNYVIFDGEVSDAVKTLPQKSPAGIDYRGGDTNLFKNLFKELSFELFLYLDLLTKSAKGIEKIMQEEMPMYSKSMAEGIVDKPMDLEIVNIYNNSVLPRLMAMRPGHKGGIMRPTVKSNVDAALNEGYTVYPDEVFKKAGKDLFGGFLYPDGHISIRYGNEDFALGHEVRHRLSGNFLPETETETTLLKSAYDDGFDELTKIHETLKDVDMNPERVTTNFDARKQAIGKYHLLNTNWELQNKIIDKLSDERIFEAVEKSNGYGKKYIKYLRDNNRLTPEKARQFREAMKYVGAVVPFASVGSTRVFNDVNR